MTEIPNEIILAAQASQARYYVPSSVSIAQWALESAWGSHFPAGSNNPFGIKAKDGQLYVSAMTWEHLGGRDVRVEQRFAKYATVADAFEAHARLLATVSLYKPAMDAWYKARDLSAGVALMAQHYATDPAYASKVMAIIKNNGLVRYDSLPQDAKAAHAAVPPAPALAKPLSVPAGPSPAPASASKPATPTPTIEDIMNPISGMLVAAQTFQTVFPLILKAGTAVIHNLPDIEKQGAELVSRLEKAVEDFKHLDINSAAEDIGAAWKAGMQIFEDVGISRELVTSVNAQAATSLPSVGSLQNVIGTAETIAKSLGLGFVSAGKPATA